MRKYEYIPLWQPFKNSSCNFCMKVEKINSSKYLSGKAYVILSYAGGSYTISTENKGSSYEKMDNITAEEFLRCFPTTMISNDDDQTTIRYNKAVDTFFGIDRNQYHPLLQDESILLLL